MGDEIQTKPVIDPTEPTKAGDSAEKIKQVVEQTKEVIEGKEAPYTTKPNEVSKLPTGRRAKSGVIDDLKEFQVQVKSFKPEDLFIPALSIIVLALLTSFVYIPMISNAVDFRSEKKEVADKVVKLTKLDKDLDQVDVGNLQVDLAAVRKVIPFSLQVTDFLIYIYDLSDEKGLESKEILAGDVQIRSTGEQRGVDPVVRGVSGPLKYVGKLQQITDFLDELQNASPFIISTDDVELRKSASEEEKERWEVSILVTGYYINKKSIPEVNVYNAYTPYTNYSDIVGTLKEKADQL